jgi:small subunit ribosomal protein S6e
VSLPRRLGPKRASKIRRLFNLGKDDDLRRYVIKRKVEKKDKKSRFKAPSVQRLVTKKTKANRVKKLKARRESIKHTAELRREFLHGLSKERMAHRQRKNAKAHRVAAVLKSKSPAVTGKSLKA